MKKGSFWHGTLRFQLRHFNLQSTRRQKIQVGFTSEKHRVPPARDAGLKVCHKDLAFTASTKTKATRVGATIPGLGKITEQWPTEPPENSETSLEEMYNFYLHTLMR